MDDLYSFGKTKYVAADPLPRSSSRLVVNVLSVWYAVIKCTVLGILLTIKSFLFNDSKQKSSKSIQHQVALVTGGANGLGRAISIELAKHGCNVAVCDVDMDGARDTVEELHSLGVKAFAYEVDVANYDEIVALKEKIKVDLGDVDILINNAALLPKISLMEGNPKDISRIMEVNLISHFWSIRVFLPGMISRNRGHIVGTSSILGLEPTCRAIAYCTTKFGIRALMDSLYDMIRMDNLNINVTTVFPPLMNTRKEFVDHFISNGGLNPTAELSYYTPEKVASATVKGILRNKQYVAMPWFMKFVLTWIQLFPEEIQNLIRSNFKPNVGPGVNESSEKKVQSSKMALDINHNK